jgi:MFS family permease
MLWADRLVGRFGSGRIFGLSLVMQFAATATVVIAPSITSIFILRAASGVYFSLYTVASIAYITEGAPAQQRATVLTLYYTTLRGIVILIASPLSGIAFDWLGAYPLYVIAMVGTFLAWLVFIISRINKPVLSRPMEV